MIFYNKQNRGNDIVKKIIAFIIIVAILAGVGYIFLANDLMMITVISNNAGKIVKHHNTTYKKTSEYTGFDIIYTNTNVEGGVEDELSSSEIKLQIDKDNYYVFANISYADSTQNKTIRYEGTIDAGSLYVASGENKAVKTVTSSNLSDALIAMSSIQGANEIMGLMDYEKGKLTSDITETYDLDAKLAFSFSPFYMGAKLVYKSVEESITQVRNEEISLTGKLHEISIRSNSSDNDYAEEKIELNSPGKEVTVRALTEEEKAAYTAA